MSFTGILASTGVGVLSLISFWLISKKPGFLRLNLMRFGILFTILIVAAISGVLFVREVTSDQISSNLIIQRLQVVLTDNTLRKRADFWMPALKMFRAYPLIGIGPGELYRNLDHFRGPSKGEWKVVLENENAHNTYLQLGAEIGIVGLTGFLTFFGWIIWQGIRFLNHLRTRNHGFNVGRNGVLAVSRQLDFRAKWDQIRTGLLIKDLDREGLQGTVVLTGLLGISGWIVFSLAQHPTLRFGFHLLLWSLAALILASLPFQGPFKVGGKPIIAVIAVVTAAMMLQYLGFQPPKQTEFVYGIYSKSTSEGNGNLYLTEGVAFFRQKIDVEEGIFRKGRQSTESVRRVVLEFSDPLFLNRDFHEPQGHPVKVFLDDRIVEIPRPTEDWQRLEIELTGREFLELGVITENPEPVHFPSSWGAGVLIRDSSRILNGDLYPIRVEEFFEDHH
jgi:hypothetical protein